MDKERLKDTKVTESSPQNGTGELDLMGRLDQLTKEEPDKYSPESIGRVRLLVQYETENPYNKKPYRFFKEVSDFSLYHTLHPEWQGKSAGEMKADTKLGGNAFYVSFGRMARTKIRDKEERKKLIGQVFEMERESWDDLNTIEKWIEELGKHADWTNRSIVEMKEDQESGASAFYNAFSKWLRVQIKDKKQRKILLKSIFKEKRPRGRKWNHIETIDGWITEYDKHSELLNISTSEMMNNVKPGARAFYLAFDKWVRKEARGDRQKRRELKDRVFHLRNFDRVSLITIIDWEDEFQKHPEWQGRLPHEMQIDKETGATAFYGAFLTWVRKTAKDEAEREAFTRALFPDKRRSPRRDEVTKLISPDEAREALMKLYKEGEDG